LKKAKKGSEAKAPARMPDVIPPGAEEHEVEEEEEEEGEATPTLRPRGLRSRGPVILAEEEHAGKSAEEAAEELEVEIVEVSTRPGTSSSHEKRSEVR